jgi:intracellular multiplication protein IcmL
MNNSQQQYNLAQSEQIESSLNLVNIRNVFYLRVYRHIILANLLAVILIFLLVGFFYYQHKIVGGSRYFATTPDGVLIEIPPLNVNHLKIKNLLVDNKGFLIEQPKINIKDLGQDLDNGLVIYWVKEVIAKMFNYDYINYRRALQELRNYFAPGAHSSFIKALYESKNLETIKNDMRITRATIVKEPTIKMVGINNNRYVWNIFVPTDIYYENISDEPIIQKVTAKLWVMRTSTLISPFFGLSVAVVNLEPRNE